MAATSPMWVFGYGSLIWNPGFAYDARVVGFVRDYRRVFYQGTPLRACFTCLPLQPRVHGRFALSKLYLVPFANGQGARTTGAHRSFPAGPSRSSTNQGRLAVLWGVAYRISREEDKQIALEHLEVREKQYDEKIYVDLYTDSSPKTPAVENVMVQIYTAEGPSGPNKEYVFKLEDALNRLGVVDPHVQDLANAVREYSDNELSK
ncbi:hypothetical protein HU200_032059 [Digitaria exilis]|uniref:glutathione-specific gamma-glutamylcyclotransferase n=1 Tax=Digitaria exilis TaxID=1010633 RepID=A0A835BN37_9POAL|nr:hypothetical protein HU200_032059 [Digitaria exilis]